MTALSRDEPRAAAPSRPHRGAAALPPGAAALPPGAPVCGRHDEPDPMDWVAALHGAGAEHAEALRRLHALMVRAAAHQVWRMRSALPDPSPGTVEIIVNQAADEAMTALLGKLDSFEGRSRFTTWAFKFAILQAATEVRRVQWQHREVQWRDLDEPRASAHDDPESHAEGADLSRAVAAAMREVLTPYQRRVAVALLVDGVPIDVLADRLGTTRGALYKTLHHVRVRLRVELTARGYLPTRPARSRGGGPGPAPANADYSEAPTTHTGGVR
ncbi:RNA polymerase sigma-70 factor (ECF subfamily) [Humibacillus xanthopallidus]|uniref:RNA polymerase sigma-70 factor (ECF subfamily) n=1 Tax=Humibacillus xanthopallidus TaxID=412689 RepID=A0A543PLY9_9MICO|nr:sigma-70 family RNA polymerase sigma factor [Humibacillus xanthopallidus]TQN45090.1 RNA polymerase sigma-70 factor (ECF subfamily) [Humibacillus xanthopallidus]